MILKQCNFAVTLMFCLTFPDRPCPTGFGRGTVPNDTIIDWEKGWRPLLQVPSYGQPLCQQQQVRTISSVTQQPLQIVRYCRVSHLSKGSSGRKQNAHNFWHHFWAQFFMPFHTVLSVLLGVLHTLHIDARRITYICGLLLLLFFGCIPCSGWPESSSSNIR